jgi:hypothetical protein
MDTILRLPQGNCKISALFDIDAENNFIFQQLAVEVNLLSERVNRSEITIDGYKIYIYNRYQLSTVTINFYKKQKELDQSYYAVNLKYYNIIFR